MKLVQNTVQEIAKDALLWEDRVPGGAHWSGIVRRGTTLRLTDLSGGANCSAIFFNHEEKLELYRAVRRAIP